MEGFDGSLPTLRGSPLASRRGSVMFTSCPSVSTGYAHPTLIKLAPERRTSKRGTQS